MKFVLNNVDLSLLLSVCGREGNLLLGSSFHALIIKNHQFFSLENGYNLRDSLVVWNSLLAMYSKCGKLSDASKLFDRMPMKDTVSWNSMLLGFLRNGDFDVGFEFLRRMHEMGCSWFDQATLTTMLSACEDKRLLHVIKMVHSLVFLIGYDRNISVGNALITSYFKCGSCDYGRQVFGEMLERNVISWTAVISGLEQNQCYEDSLELFMDMRCLSVDVEPNDLTYLCLLSACAGLQAQLVGRQIHGLVLKLGVHSNVCFESALMDMYSKCGCLEDAWKIFESAEVLDEVTVTVLLVGFAQNGFEEEALHVFLKMLRTGTEIDANMISAVLGVFGIDTSLSLGKQIHSLAIKRSFSSNVFIGNGLINMYSKCGDLEDSVKIFDRMPQKNPVSWNSIIAAFARKDEVMFFMNVMIS
ncbi:Pentatricopeptide repeat [Dillenia turbinata]|uniref:Pentatricopeptide repeat n=1 Tax=Dillenia turbinata TaxID=194707 RepID=A0AAN8YZT9_9MAGN